MKFCICRTKSGNRIFSPLGQLPVKALAVSICGVDHRRAALGEKLPFGLIVAFDVAVVIQMFRCKIGKGGTGKEAPIQPLLLQRLGGGLHHHMGAAALKHLGQQLLQLPGVGGGIARGDGLLSHPVADGADQPRPDPQLDQRVMCEPGRGGLAVGAGDAQQLELSCRVAKEGRTQPGVNDSRIREQELVRHPAVPLCHH